MSEQVTISTMLEAEHRWIDERFEQFSRGLAMGLVKADTLQEAASVLHRHIYLEEEFYSRRSRRGALRVPQQ